MTEHRSSWSVLTPAQTAIAQKFLAERETERRHLVVYLSGAHAYGFPSPDSDLDLKCIHIAPTNVLLGLYPVADSNDRIDVVDGVELDYGSNELGPVLAGAIKGNGNYLERILGELVLYPEDRAEPDALHSRPEDRAEPDALHSRGDAALLARAREVVRPVLSRRVARHYKGFATSQLHAFDVKPTAKRALYVLRTAATGRHLMAHGEMVTDVGRLGAFIPDEITELLAIKQRGERSELDSGLAMDWRARLVDAIAGIDLAWPTSILPPEPPAEAIAAIDIWLVELRLRESRGELR